MDPIIERIVLEELMDDHINMNLMGAVISNLVEPLYLQRLDEDEDYYEDAILNYTPDDFRNNFRISRTTFQNLLNILQQRNGDILSERVCFEKELLFTLWMLSKPESFHSAEKRFNLVKDTSHKIFFAVVDLITSLRHEFIVWPDELERQRISRELQLKSGIPGIIGAIGACHIAIKAPSNNADDYCNRNNYHSVILQAVCNDKKQFIYVFVGTPGRLHQANVFKNSDLYPLLTNDNPPLSYNEHLLGDAAYPLLPCLLKPYRDNCHLNQRQTTFNTKISSILSVITQTFGLLKSKFRRLKYLEIDRIDLVPSVITAACILHNFIINHEGIVDFEGEVDVAEENKDYCVSNNEENTENVAHHKRDYIASLLN